MTKAKDMFKELGYECDDSDKDNNEQYSIEYRREYKSGLGHLAVSIITMYNQKYYTDYIHIDTMQKLSNGMILPFTLEITKELHQAIHQQMKELGWLDD